MLTLRSIVATQPRSSHHGYINHSLKSVLPHLWALSILNSAAPNNKAVITVTSARLAALASAATVNTADWKCHCNFDDRQENKYQCLSPPWLQQWSHAVSTRSIKGLMTSFPILTIQKQYHSALYSRCRLWSRYPGLWTGKVRSQLFVILEKAYIMLVQEIQPKLNHCVLINSLFWTTPYIFRHNGLE